MLDFKKDAGALKRGKTAGQHVMCAKRCVAVKVSA